jgi:monosaccharide ABC transporter ATP-binding protein, CUT2 family (TC 3.A.1.2.-)
MVGREISDIWGWRGRPAGEVRLKVEGITGSKLPRPIDFEARAGEIVGFFGLVGSGRSELMRLVYGADPRHSGKVAIDGADSSGSSPRRSIREGWFSARRTASSTASSRDCLWARTSSSPRAGISRRSGC